MSDPPILRAKATAVLTRISGNGVIGSTGRLAFLDHLRQAGAVRAQVIS